MVAVDASGTPVRISGAALAGGPLLAIAARRRLQDLTHVTPASGERFPAAFRRAFEGAAPSAEGTALAIQHDALPVRWGIPAFFDGAPYGPPYEMENRAAEWLLSADAGQTFFGPDRQARMAQRVHPRGPALQTGGTFLAALYGISPAPRSLGIGVDYVR